VKADWPVERCVLCLREADPADAGTRLTSAHIIPRSVGGKLEVPFLCFDCNSRMGHEVEGPLLSDPGIRACVEALAAELPTRLLNDMRKRQLYFAETDLGPIEAAMTAEGELIPLESATFKREKHAKAEMEEEWRREDLSEEEMAKLLDAFENAPPGELLRLPGFTVRPRIDLDGLDFRLPWKEDLVSETLPLGIAFLYLSFYLGKTCYEAHLLDGCARGAQAQRRLAVRALEHRPSPPRPGLRARAPARHQRARTGRRPRPAFPGARVVDHVPEGRPDQGAARPLRHRSGERQGVQVGSC
jgi:hypothetical protein